VLQAGFSWASDDDGALEGVRAWKGAQPEEFYKEEVFDPRAMYEQGEREVSDEDLREGFIVASDPEVHAERIREIERLGATIICLANNSGADPRGAIEIYGEQVLPALRRRAAESAPR
jgi:coenzyme F420-dependent glucose-6-phosphate dehydrogenase